MNITVVSGNQALPWDREKSIPRTHTLCGKMVYSSRRLPMGPLSIPPFSEDQGQKQSPCPEILPHIKTQFSPEAGSLSLRSDCNPLLCWGIQAPAWILYVEFTQPLSTGLLRPHGYGERTCKLTKWMHYWEKAGEEGGHFYSPGIRGFFKNNQSTSQLSLASDMVHTLHKLTGFYCQAPSPMTPNNLVPERRWEQY